MSRTERGFFIWERGDGWPTATPLTKGRFNDPTQMVKWYFSFVQSSMKFLTRDVNLTGPNPIAARDANLSESGVMDMYRPILMDLHKEFCSGDSAVQIAIVLFGWSPKVIFPVFKPPYTRFDPVFTSVLQPANGRLSYQNPGSATGFWHWKEKPWRFSATVKM